MWKELTKPTLFIVLLFVANQGMADSWARAFGGTSSEEASSVQQTSDGGYIVAGGTSSFGAGRSDFLVLKLSSSGTQEWVKTFGVTGWDEAYSVQQTSDGGYIVAGRTNSFGAGNDDFLVLKLDSSGTQEWARTFGRTNHEEAQSVQQTSDGGYIVAGRTNSFGAGSYDFLVLKLNSSCAQEWARTFGGMSDDCAHSVQQTSDGGYIVAGDTDSFGAVRSDFSVLKLSSSGTLEWVKTFGGINYDYARSVQQTSDGGYIVAGYTDSFGAGSYDFLVLKLSSSGTQEWAKTLGRTAYDGAYSVELTSDGGYILGGNTRSFGAGSHDFLVLKLDSSGTQEWARAFGGTDLDCAESVQQTSDGGYIVAGYTYSFGAGRSDFLVLKIGSDGSMADDCPWTVCSLHVTTPSLGTDCSPDVDSLSLGADCSPQISSLELATEDICSEIEVEEDMRFNAVESIYLDVFPSVGRNNSSAEYRIPREETHGLTKEYGVSLKLYDVCGRVEKTLFEGNLRSGSYSRDLDLSDFAPGIHFLRLEIENRYVVRKIEVFR